ncbi:hypothetical protein [Bacteroides acidifaciens]|uniref:hypothetical protein n=1 Tax=Bacteroides acidifaciens TaxID=85831 RepID=UPI0026F10C47|nr:hypothetical protein [Bacteroides acidifaciens]
MNTKTLDQIKNEYYGEIGMPERDRLERELEALRIGFKIRNAREKLNMTQAELIFSPDINSLITSLYQGNSFSSYFL